MFLRFEIFNKYKNSETNLTNTATNTKASTRDLILFYSPTTCSDEQILQLKHIVSNSVLQEATVVDDKVALENHTFDVLLLPGMTDNVAQSIQSALSLTDLKSLSFKVHSGKTYKFLTEPQSESLDKELVNPVVHFSQSFKAGEIWTFPKAFLQSSNIEATYQKLPIASLKAWMQSKMLALNEEEMQVIYDFFKNDLKRDPTDVEIEIIAQTWSEHCKHKIFAANYDYQESSRSGKIFGNQKISSLFASFIKTTVKPHHTSCVSVFHDNAGVMRWDPNVDLCIKVETHNSPSALDPFSGAVTGVLGVQRDIMGTGRGAKPIANMDVFCVGDTKDYPKANDKDLPLQLLSPSEILRGVHKGVEEGGNKMGVPTINGSFQFHPNFAGKPLIFVGSLGLMPQKIKDKDCFHKEIFDGDLVYVGGGRLGRDGIHGATFSSLSLEGEVPPSVVQIGDPITQKKLLDFTLKARDMGYIRGLTDNGAGGISSSVGELAQYTNGVQIAIDKHPLKYEGLQCFEMVISESQERMTYAVPPEFRQAFETLAIEFGVEVSCLGNFNASGKFEITYKEEVVANLPLSFLHEACPKMNLKANWLGPQEPSYWFRKRPYLQTAVSLKDKALHLLSSANICSKESWVRAYDHEVQGATIGKPFQGKTKMGPSNAGIIDLEIHGGKQNTAVALAHGFSAKLSTYDTYWMAQMAIDECIRNLVSSGANPKKIALLDNFCWPNPFLEDSAHRLGQLVRANLAIKDMADLFDLPFISGKDSMKNSFSGKNLGGKDIQINVEPTLLVSGIGYVEDHSHQLPSSFAEAEHLVYFVGVKPKSLVGSDYSYFYSVQAGIEVPDYDFNAVKNNHYKVHQAIASGILASIHDVSDGGLITCLLEKTIGNRIGLKLAVNFEEDLWFGEAPGGYVVSLKKDQEADFKHLFSDYIYLGETTADYKVEAKDFSLSGEEIVSAWRTPLC